MAKAVCKGGGSVKRLLQRWEKGRYATWNFKIYYNELEAERLKEENCILRVEKRKLEHKMNIIETKKAKIETKLKEAVEKNRKTRRESKKKFKKLTQKLIRQQRRQSTRGSSKSKTRFSDYSKRHQLRIRRQMVQDCEVSLAFLGLHNYVATKVEVFNENIQEFETINLVDEGEINMSSDTETLTN